MTTKMLETITFVVLVVLGLEIAVIPAHLPFP